MNRSFHRFIASRIGKLGIGWLAAAMLFGIASLADAAVFSSGGRPLIQSFDAAGTGEFNEFDGLADEASFRHPAAVLVFGDGSILVADSGNHRIRIIRDGHVSVYAGIPVSLVFDEAGLPAGALLDGPKNEALFWNPIGMAVDRNGVVYVADAGNHAIRKVFPSGRVTTLAGNGVLGSKDGKGSEASFHRPSDVVVDAEGNVYVADTLNHAIRKITPQGEVTTLNALPVRIVEVADGTFVLAGGFADGPLAEALFNEPTGLALDSKGNLYVSDTGNQRIRYIDFAAGTVTTVAGGGDLAENALYVAGDYVDGPATEARFNMPKGIAVAPDGGLYIADSLNHAVRFMNDGRVITIVGNDAAQYGSRNGFDEEALLHHPTDVAVDANGDLYIADMDNNKIRKVEYYALPEGWTADGTIRVLLNNQHVTFDKPILLRSGRTMAPLRAVAESAGFVVHYTGEEVVLSGEGAVLTLAPGNPEVSIERGGASTVVTLDVAPLIQDGLLYVPIRHVAETAGIHVDWHAETTTVILRK